MPSWTNEQQRALPPPQATAIILPINVKDRYLQRARREAEQARAEIQKTRVWVVRKHWMAAVSSNIRKLLIRKRVAILFMLTTFAATATIGLNSGVLVGRESVASAVPVQAQVAVPPQHAVEMPSAAASSPNAEVAAIQESTVADVSAANGQSDDVALKFADTLSFQSKSPPPVKEQSP